LHEEKFLQTEMKCHDLYDKIMVFILNDYIRSGEFRDMILS